MKNLDQYILESLKGYKPSTLKPKEQLPEDCKKYFYYKRVDNAEIENLDTSNVTNMGRMFESTKFNNTSVDLSNWDVSNVKDMNSMFGWSNIEYLDLSSWDVSNVKDISSMFDTCTHLEYLDMSGWDTSNICTVGTVYTFSACYALSDIRFGPGWFKSKNMKNLILGGCNQDNLYKLSDETYESMLTMYNRKKAGFENATLWMNRANNIPDGWIEKMEERGYIIDYV